MSHTHRWSYFYAPGDAYRYCACGAAETVSPDGEHGPVPEKDQGFVKRHIERLEKSAEAIKKTLGPFTFEIDRPKGTTKEWPGGKSFTYPVDYGFFPKLRGEDGEGLDAFVGDDPNGHLESFQKLKPNEDGKLVADETKYLLGVNDRQRETIYRLYGQEINARRVYDSWDGVEKSLERFEASVKEAALAKLARVPTNVKQYRRALQMFVQRDHDFHGTNNLAGGVNAGELVVGPNDMFGTGGAYFSRGEPLDYYFQGPPNSTSGQGGFAVPRAQMDAAGAKVIRATEHYPVPYTSTRRKPLPLSRGTTIIRSRPLVQTKTVADEAQRRLHLRRIDPEAYQLARDTFAGKTSVDAAQQQLKGNVPFEVPSGAPQTSTFLTRRNAAIAGGTLASLAAIYGAHHWLRSRRESEQDNLGAKLGFVKTARVPTNVKQYRRALQMLEQGDHDFHGTNNMADVVRRGKVVGGPRDVFNTGGKAYLSRGKPVDEYFHPAYLRDGGFAFPRQQIDAAGGAVIPQTQNNHIQYTAARSVPLSRGATVIVTRPDGAEAASAAQRRFHLRRIDAEPFELAQATLRGYGNNDTPGVVQHKLKGLPGEYVPANFDAPSVTPAVPSPSKFLNRRNAAVAGGALASAVALYGVHRWLRSRRENGQQEQEKAAGAFEALNWVPTPYQGRMQSPQEIVYAARSRPALAATQENLRMLQVAQDPYGTGAPTQGVSHHHRRHHH